MSSSSSKRPRLSQNSSARPKMSYAPLNESQNISNTARRRDISISDQKSYTTVQKKKVPSNLGAHPYSGISEFQSDSREACDKLHPDTANPICSDQQTRSNAQAYAGREIHGNSHRNQPKRHNGTRARLVDIGASHHRRNESGPIRSFDNFSRRNDRNN